jgi:hypothetical protein
VVLLCGCQFLRKVRDDLLALRPHLPASRREQQVAVDRVFDRSLQPADLLLVGGNLLLKLLVLRLKFFVVTFSDNTPRQECGREQRHGDETEPSWVGHNLRSPICAYRATYPPHLACATGEGKRKVALAIAPETIQNRQIHDDGCTRGKSMRLRRNARILLKDYWLRMCPSTGLDVSVGALILTTTGVLDERVPTIRRRAIGAEARSPLVLLPEVGHNVVLEEAMVVDDGAVASVSLTRGV